MAIPTHWMAYYADRFIKETAQLRPIEHSAYYRLFESYAQTGYLINDPYMLRSIVKLDAEITVIQGLTGTTPDYGTWVEFTNSIIESLLARFFTLAPDGTYHHPGWDKELEKARDSYDAKVRGAAAANDAKRRAKEDAERNAAQRTTYNEDRTTVQPSIGSTTSENKQPIFGSHTPEIGQLTAEEPERPANSGSEHLRAGTEQAVKAGSAFSGSSIPAEATGQKPQKPSATGRATRTGLTAAESSASFTAEQQAEIDKHPPRTRERLAAIQKFSSAA